MLNLDLDQLNNTSEKLKKSGELFEKFLKNGEEVIASLPFLRETIGDIVKAKSGIKLLMGKYEQYASKVREQEKLVKKATENTEKKDDKSKTKQEVTKEKKNPFKIAKPNKQPKKLLGKHKTDHPIAPKADEIELDLKAPDT